MTRLIVLATFLAAMSVANLEAQIPVVNHWGTSGECSSATTAPNYRPSVASQKPLGSNEVIQPHPTGACVDMIVPESLGGRRWVRIEAGRPFVFNQRAGKMLRLAECDNEVFGEVRFLLVPQVSQQQLILPGPSPASGRPFTVENNLTVNIEEAGRRAVERQVTENSRRRSSRENDKDDDNGSWIGRHWPWVIPVGAGIGVGLVCALSKDGCFNHTQIVTVH